MAPIVSTRVLHHHQHLTEAPQRRQGLDRLHRQGRNSEHHHTLGQNCRPSRGGQTIEHLHEPGMHRRARRLGLGQAHILLQGPPQMRLPCLVFRHRFGRPCVGPQNIAAHRPIVQPISPVTLVAVQHIGHLLRQLVELAPIAVTGQIMSQRIVHSILCGHLRQQAQQAPDQSCLVKWHVHRHSLCAQHAAVHLPQKCRGQLHTGGSANAQSRLVSQGQLQPVLHPVALYQKKFGLQWR